MYAICRLWLNSVVSLVLSLFFVCADSSAHPPVGSVHEFGFDLDGGLMGLSVQESAKAIPRVATLDLDSAAALNIVGVETTQNSGPSKNRLDLVFVGDGFSAEELPLFRELVAQHSAKLFDTSPFREYRSFFNVHRVDVASDLSGVTLDPGRAAIGAAPSLGTSFSCFGNARLLCANEGQVLKAAAFAPEVDQVFVVANTGTYGGAGYFTSGIAVYSGLHPNAFEIMAHEAGHSLALLGDEYDVGGTNEYSGPEVNFPNISILSADSMIASSSKWFRWLGHFLPESGGRVDTFEGADFALRGKFRPTETSKMRVLGEPFNPPSKEAFIARFYEYVRPIDDALPRTGRVRVGRTLRVSPITGAVGDQKIEWLVDGVVKRRSSKRFKPLLRSGKRRTHHIEARVGDRSPLVKDTKIQKDLMTNSRAWIAR